MASRHGSITGRSWGSCQISGEDVGDTVDRDRDWTGTRRPEGPGPGYNPRLEHRSQALLP